MDMRKGIRRGLRAAFCVALAMVMTLTGIQMPSFGGNGRIVRVAEAASTTGRVPMWAYMKSGSGRLTTYTSNNLRKSTGYIVPGDYCKIMAFYSNGSVKVNYPTSRGWRTAYAAMSGFMASTGFDTRTRQLGKRLTAYRRSAGGATIGTVYASDQVLVVGRANGRTQVQYPCSGGYKLGWVSGTYSSSTGSNPQGCVDGVTSPGAGKITVRGWTFDRDSLGKNLQVHVYVGGPAGSGAPGYVVTANAYRPDVNKVYPGVGNYYGFHATLSVSKRGVQNVYIYAINVGGGTGNPLLATKRVNILGGNANPPAAKPSGSTTSTAQKMVNYELSQLGVGDYRGNNNVKYNTWYYGRAVSGSGYAWCMAFQSYCASQLGVLGTAVPKTASCAVAVNWYKSRGQFQYARHYGGKYTPKAGDLVFYYSGGSFCHVGMVTAAPVNGYLQTVEGNIQCSDGNWKVVRFTKNSKRTVNNSYVYGYGTPRY